MRSLLHLPVRARGRQGPTFDKGVPHRAPFRLAIAPLLPAPLSALYTSLAAATMDAHATASTSTTGDQQRRAAQHTYPPSQQPPSRRSSSPSSTTVLSIGFQLARLIQMVVTRFLSLLGNTLPLSVLLPSITLQPGSLVGVAPPDEAAEGYRRRLEVFCQSYNPPDTDSHADLASSSSTLPNDDAVLRVPRSLLPGSYDDAIARSKSENQVLMVVLESGPHQSTTRFRTETLLNPYLDTLLSQEGILLWSADVCDRDGTQGKFAFLGP